MVTLSERSMWQAVAPSVRWARINSNPARRGPVVLATDGTTRSGAAVVAAQLIAERLDLSVEVISALEPMPACAAVPDVVISSDAVIDEARRRSRETAVRDYVCRFSGGGTPSRVHVRFGSVATEISRFAREVSATIVVMGSPTHRRFRNLTAGDQAAAQVLHSARCPVLSVPPMFTELPRVVVAAVDFGRSSVRAAQAALLLVADGGTVVLTHVLAPGADKLSDATTHVRAQFDRLRDEMARYAPANVRIETRLIMDAAIDGILSSADDLEAELVTVGAHEHGLFGQLLLGTVTESVLHNADHPVLAAPPQLAEIH